MNINWSRSAVAALALVCVMTAGASAQVDVGGQVRPRTEGRAGSGPDDAFTSMRSRVSVNAALSTSTRAFVQLQDVRLWGEEVSTTASLNRIDLHQAFIDVGRDSSLFAARVGRQEASFGEERLVGALDWVQSGRAFDGARVRLNAGSSTLNVMGFQIADAGAGVPDERFYGLYYTLKPAAAAAVELYGLHNRGGTSELEQTTLGGRLAAAYGPLSYRVESAWQGGSRATSDVNAYLVAGTVGLNVTSHARVSLWYDRLSGDDEPLDGTVRVFDTLYGTNHKFYGLADIFTNIPVHTAGLGLQDAALKLSCAVLSTTDAAVELHHMRAAADIPLVSDGFVNEADLTLTHRISSRLAVQGGVSAVDVLDGLRAVRPDQRDHVFGYMMLNAAF
ncbi:MAG TPA: alginate export family protein [Longimicrobiales bacterium]